MGNLISEGLEYIGGIDDNGYVFDRSCHCIAKINDSGYIGKVGGGDIWGKIDEDGTIRDASLNVVGRVQADGYVYIHSKRVCKVSSTFIERITPDAWNAGQSSTYSGRSTTTSRDNSTNPSSGISNFLFSSFFIKLVLGIILGIVLMVNGTGGPEMLIGGPLTIFLFSFIYKLFNH